MNMATYETFAAVYDAVMDDSLYDLWTDFSLRHLPKTKDKKKRSLYISSAIPAFLGITEAAIFGVNLRFIKPFIFACIGGAASGMFASMMKLAGTGMGITAIPGTLLYINTGLIQYFITIAIGFAISFALTYIFFKPQE